LVHTSEKNYVIASDRKFMELAVREMYMSISEHSNKPDPMVGAVLVDKHGREFATAHRCHFSGGDHAEFSIFEKLTASDDVTGSTLYVTLEPCTKRNKPKKPCAQIIVEKGVTRVVIGILDPNPEIYGKGVEFLKSCNIKVDFFDDDLAEEIRIWNERFINHMENPTPDTEGELMKNPKLEGHSLEERKPIIKAEVTDFSIAAVTEYLGYVQERFKIPSDELWRYFEKSGYLEKRGNKLVPTLAGLILFAEKPDTYHPEHRVIATRFFGTPEDSKSIERAKAREVFTGPLTRLINDVVGFYKDNVDMLPRLNGIRRIDADYEYPETVVREVVVNALVHRDYSVEGAHVSFLLYEDRLIVKSPGHLLSPNTLERINKFDVTPVRRNALIARSAHDMKLMETEGEGIPKMPASLKNHGLRPPNFSYDGGYFIVTLFGREMSPLEFRINSELYFQLTPRQIKILDYVQEYGRITTRDAIKQFTITRGTALKDFTALVELRLLSKKGTGKGTYYTLSKAF
jgi:ATP-dependent DNA helicase RecG